MNRGSRKALLFCHRRDYAAFERVLVQGLQRIPIRLLAYCAMPNHWHLVVWPRADGDLSKFMHWVTTTHAQRLHAANATQGMGALYQGRFKAFPVENDGHLVRVLQYVERNPLRAQLVDRAETWRWSSLWHRLQRSSSIPLTAWPVEAPEDWVAFVNQRQPEDEVDAVRVAIRRGTPMGSERWCRGVVTLLGGNRRRRSPRSRS